VPRRVDLADRLRPLAGIALLALALAIVALGPWVLWIAIPLMWCRITGRARHRHRYRHREIEPSPANRDELTLVSNAPSSAS
jgi:hypothetical protein